MKCEACANGLKNALEALRGDLQADVLFEEGLVFLVAGVATGFNEEGQETAASVLQALEEGIAEVMDERGYSYHSTDPSRESPAPHPPQHYLERKEL
jgi:copper chaperone CopZ